jgi:L-ascorbate metabolism protein UlaG (beta-lactamase superfamily)
MHAIEKLEVPDRCLGIHWFGQNSFAFKDPHGTILLVDPYFPHHRPPSEFIHPSPPLEESEIAVDVVLLTHDHGDHTCPESLLRIHAASPQAQFYGPHESVQRLKELGIPGHLLSVLTAGSAVQAKMITIHTLYSKPPEGVPAEGIPVPDVDHFGYVIEIGSVRAYVSGDLIYSFARHTELMQPVRQLQPEIGFLTTHPTEGEFPDFSGSVAMAVKLGLKAAVPAHYDCFVKRTFDPNTWAAGFPIGGPKPVILAYNKAVLYCPG